MSADVGSGAGPRIERARATAHTFPLPEPESDGTATWDSVTAVVVTLESAGQVGTGWTFSSPAAAAVIEHHLAQVACEHGAFAISAGWQAMRRAGRNFGTSGLWMQAQSAVDIAWWDLKARLLGVSVAALAGQLRADVPLYGSGGFTNLTDRQLEDQIAAWTAVGAHGMKIKIGERRGSAVGRDLHRVRQLARLAGPDVELMVDANGGYRPGQALRVGRELDRLGVVWFEEPVTSDHPEELAMLRAQLSCDVAAGEYAASPDDVRALLPAVDCLQLDATRCGGFTGFLRAAALAAAGHLDVSAHCAPALHAAIGVAVPNIRHVEYFADHVRVEAQLVDGAPLAARGALRPDPSRPGHGMRLRGAADRLGRSSRPHERDG